MGTVSDTARNWRYSPFASVYGSTRIRHDADTAIWSQPDAALGGVSNATGEGYDWYSGGVGGNGINDSVPRYTPFTLSGIPLLMSHSLAAAQSM